MTAKIKLEDARQEFIIRGYIPLFDKYEGTNKRLLAQTKEGYKVITTLHHLKADHVTNIFSGLNPYTLENIRLWLILNKKPFKLLSTEFTSVGKYKLEFITKEGYRVSSSLDNLQRKLSTNIFSNVNPYTIENIKLWMKINSSIYKLADKQKYVNNSSKLICICEKHGEFNEAWSSIQEHKKCNQCARESNKGKNHYNWKGGITPINSMARRTLQYVEWRKQIFYRDNYTCQCCGKQSGRLQAHHLENFATNKELRLEVSNGVTLCRECHSISVIGSFHNLYGTRNNDNKQFEKFRKNYQLTSTN